MKSVKTFIGLLLLAIAFTAVIITSCSKNDSIDNSEFQTTINEPQENNLKAESSYFDENVAIIGVTIRSLDEENYVRQINLMDFSGEPGLDEGYGIGEDLFADNGELYDEEAGDGIYTSQVTYAHSEQVPYDVNNTLQMASKDAFINDNFQYVEELNSYLANNSGGGSGVGGGISIKCKTKWIECGEGGYTCIACELGLSWGCILFYDCEVEVSLTW